MVLLPTSCAYLKWWRAISYWMKVRLLQVTSKLLKLWQKKWRRRIRLLRARSSYKPILSWNNWIDSLKKFGYAKWQGTFDVLKKRLETPAETPSTRLLRTQGKHETLADYGAFLAQNYQEAALLKVPSRDKNTQTILDEAIISGLSYQEVMPSQGIVELNGKLLKRGSRRQKESAIMTELWQQKQLAKQYLSGQAVNTSQAWIVNNRQELSNYTQHWRAKLWSLKNALGDSKAQTQLFRLPPTQAELTHAFEKQAKETDQVMIEQVVQGSVYRALIVNDEIISLVERIPANGCWWWTFNFKGIDQP